METYVRHLWVLGSDYKVQISDPQPATELSGFKQITVTVSQGLASQEVRLLVSNDGAKILEGKVYNADANPFKENLDKLKTQFQPSLGTPGAPVVIVGFSDMECPHCKDEAKMIRDNLIQAYPTQVRFYFKDFPLSSIHPWAKAAAIAGRCVFDQTPSAFWDFHDWIFAHQESVTPDTLNNQVLGWAKGEKDIDALQLTRCMENKSTEAEVDANVAQAKALNVDGTPTLFVNGRRVSAGTEWKDLKRIIDEEIKYQQVAKDAGENCGCDVSLSAPGLPASAPAVGPLSRSH